MRRVVTLFEVRGANQVQAQLGQMRSGFGGYRQELNRVERQQSIVNNQLRALGTTIRYAFAGSAVYGVFNLVRGLEETQRQLAMIDFLGNFKDVEGGARGADNALQSLYENSERGAQQALTPVGEFNDAMVNLYSSVQNLTPDKAVALTTAVAEGAQLAMVQTDELTKAVSGLNQAYGRTQNVRNFQQIIRGFTTLIKRAPGGATAGQAIIQQLGPLGAVGRLANVSPTQLFGLLTTELRGGGTPATGARGLQYLLQSIAAPHPAEAKVLSSIGITPDFVQKYGGWAAIQRLMAHVQQMGVTGNLRGASRVSDDTLDLLDASGQPLARQTQGLGVGGEGIQFLSKAIGRIHGVRALISLMSQQQTGSLQGDLAAAATAMGDTDQATKDFADQWTEFARKQPLKAATIDLDILRRNIAQAIAPGLNIAARGIHYVQQHNPTDPNVARAEVAGGALGLYLLARRFGTGGGARGALRGVGGAYLGVGAAQDVLSGTHERGSFSNPMYVIVVNQLFGGRPGARIPNRDLRTAAGEVGVGVPGRAARTPSRWSRVRTGAGGLFGSIGASLVIGEAVDSYMRTRGLVDTTTNQDRRQIQGNPLLKYLGMGYQSAFSWHYANKPTKKEQEILDRYRGNKISNIEAERLLRQVATPDQLGKAGIQLSGKANVQVDITQKDAVGKTTHRKRAHVTVDLFPNFTQPAPQRKGKNKTPRSGQ